MHRQADVLDDTTRRGWPLASPLMLSSRLLALADDAGRAGFAGQAEQLLQMALAVLDEAPPPAR